MSDQPDNELSLDLQFLPDWAQDDVGKNKYANHSGEDRPQRGGGRKVRDAIGMTEAEAGMTGDLAVIDDHRAKAGAINADHDDDRRGPRTSGAAIRVVEILNAHRRRSWI